MDKYSFYDPGLAEIMFRYISQDDVYADYCFAMMKDNLSIAEYCVRRFDDFRTFCETNYGFSIYKPHEAI